jgi:hypothetical protein
MLPDFVSRYFDECATGKVSTGGGLGAVEDLEYAKWVTMMNADGDVLAEPTVEGDVVLRINWVKSS